MGLFEHSDAAAVTERPKLSEEIIQGVSQNTNRSELKLQNTGGPRLARPQLVRILQ